LGRGYLGGGGWRNFVDTFSASYSIILNRPSLILPTTGNYQNRRKLILFDAIHVEYDIIKHFASFCQHFVLLSPKESEKHAFLLKNGLTTTYDAKLFVTT